MIQILVCDKVYVTPAMRRKKMLYRIYFILSICLIFSLFFYYIYAEYDRNKSEQVSQEILQGISIDEEPKERELDYEPQEEIDDTTIKVEDNVIVVVLNDETEEEVDMNELLVAARRQIEENENNEEEDIPPQLYTASDGKQYYTVAVITIPKLGISYPVLTNENTDMTIEKLLKVSVCKYHGPNPNRVGNFCIVGHNYKNSKFFSKLDTLEIMDVIQLQDMSGKVCEYAVYDKFVIEPDDTRCTSQLTDGKKEVTLITCYNNGKQRTVIKAVEIK